MTVPPNSILIGIPTAGAVYTEPFEAITNLCTFTTRWWMERYGVEPIVGTKITSRLATDRARNIIAATAINEKFDWILWIDDDMDVPFDLVPKLMKLNAPIASGLYQMRTDKPEMVVYNFDENRVAWAQTSDRWHGVADFGAVGFGCVLMKREPLEAVWNKVGDEKPFKYTKKWKSEDLYFFDHAEQLGYKVRVDCGVKVGHVGTKVWVPPERVGKTSEPCVSC